MSDLNPEPAVVVIITLISVGILIGFFCLLAKYHNNIRAHEYIITHNCHRIKLASLDITASDEIYICQDGEGVIY